MKTTIEALSVKSTEFGHFSPKMGPLPNEQLFVANINLWESYILNLPDHVIQEHTCNTCRHFIRKYGSLVTVNEDGTLNPVVWPSPEEVPNIYRASIAEMRAMLRNAGISRVFTDEPGILGEAFKNGWEHFAVKHAFRSNKSEAEYAEDYKNLRRSLGYFTKSQVLKGIALIDSHSILRGEKLKPHATWLLECYNLLETRMPNRRRNNLFWKKVVVAPPGFCAVKSSALGAMLEDIKNNLLTNEVQKRINKVMDPLNYMRPKAAPSETLINKAEDLVNQYGIELSLARRFATIEDMELIWDPKLSCTAEPHSVFSSLKADLRSESELVSPLAPEPITWVKFSREVLANVLSMRVYIPNTRRTFHIFVAAVYPTAPNILKWNNSVSWYTLASPRYPKTLELTPGWHDVRGISLFPHAWPGADLEQNSNLTLKHEIAIILDDGIEIYDIGSCLFPEIIQSRFHSIRKVIEAYSQKTLLQKTDKPQVVTVGLGSTVEVTTKHYKKKFIIDRWD